jgi:hypothetical protein
MTPGRRQTVALAVKIASGSAYVTLVTDGTNPLSERWDLVGSTEGTGEWIGFPQARNDMVRFCAPSDATYARLLVGAAANSDVYYCDVHGGHGTMRMYELWQDHDRPGRGWTYTPTGTGVLNVTTVTPGLFTAKREDNVVSVSGAVVVDPAAAGPTTFRLSVPIDTNFGAAGDASGWIVQAQAALVGDVTAAAATDDVFCGFVSPDGNQRTFQIGVQYRVI